MLIYAKIIVNTVCVTGYSTSTALFVQFRTLPVSLLLDKLSGSDFSYRISGIAVHTLAGFFRSGMLSATVLTTSARVGVVL